MKGAAWVCSSCKIYWDDTKRPPDRYYPDPANKTEDPTCPNCHQFMVLCEEDLREGE